MTFYLIYSGVRQDQDQVQAVEESNLCPPKATSCQQPSKAATKEDHSNIRKVKKEEKNKIAETLWNRLHDSGTRNQGMSTV